MQCREVPGALVAGAGGELASGDAQALAAHLEACARCRDAAAREQEWSGFLRNRLGAAGPAPGALRARIGASLDAERAGFLARVFGSPWVPRLATAAVLAVVALGIVFLSGRGAPAMAQAAAARHACHDPTPEGPLPPCCTDLALRAGDALGAAYGAVRVPDLTAVGLDLVRATRCTFGDDPVVYLAYADAAGSRFSLYISDHGVREFRLLRHSTRNGVPQARSDVPLSLDRDADAGRVEVVLWLHQGDVFTWVGPAGSGFESALARLQAIP